MALSWFLLQIPVKFSSLPSEDIRAPYSEQSALQRRVYITYSCLCSARGEEREALVCWWQAWTGLVPDLCQQPLATRVALSKQACGQQPSLAPVRYLLGLSTSRSGVTWNRRSGSLGQHTESITFCQCNKCPPWIWVASALTCQEIPSFSDIAACCFCLALSKLQCCRQFIVGRAAVRQCQRSSITKFYLQSHQGCMILRGITQFWILLGTLFYHRKTFFSAYRAI